MAAARRQKDPETGLQMDDVRSRQKARDALAKLPDVVEGLRGQELGFAADVLHWLTQLAPPPAAPKKH